MSINMNDVPFSRRGSYMSLNILPKAWNHPGIALRSHRTPGGIKEAFNLIPQYKGKDVDFSTLCKPDQLTIQCKSGQIDCCYEDVDVLRLRGRGPGLRIRSISGSKPTVFPNGENSTQIICPQNCSMYSLIPISGDIQISYVHFVSHQNKKQKAPDGDWFTCICGADGAEWELLIHDYATQPRKLNACKTYAQAHKQATKAWQAFNRKKHKVPSSLKKTAELARFVNYTSIINPGQPSIKRQTMLMSKNWMGQCWSWDHCINAIAHASTDPDLAWDLFQGPFDHQNSDGCLPDSYNGGGSTWSFTKPPIHGWTLGWMRRLNKKVLNSKRIKTAEEQLTAWTGWWLTHRDSDSDGLPEYRHGNDSGWDNGTVFDVGYPMCAPDLPAYLVLQMDQLAELAELRNKSSRARSWRKQADTLLQLMIDRLWVNDQFLARRAFTGERPVAGDCLLNHIPIILGKRLPAKYRKHLINALKPDGRFITANGPATESPQSALYGDDSYWRGPIWGPETVMIVDGLWRSGAKKEALETARRYCRMCKADQCMAENYNARTGVGLRDRAYTWGSSAFLICAQLLAK